jgi:transposase
MKKDTTEKAKAREVSLTKSLKTQLRKKAAKERLTVGLDLGDRSTACCVLDAAGEVLWRETLPTTKGGLSRVFEGMARCTIALEVGTHSPWISRHLASLGHRVIVANAREVAYINRSSRKRDPIDAEKLARLARADEKLLCPIRHRGEAAQRDLMVLRARDQLVQRRAQLIGSVRGMVKSFGVRLKGCDADNAGLALVAEMGDEIRSFAEPLLQVVEEITKQIQEYDSRIAAMEKRYPEVELLEAVWGVGTLISLAFILTLEDARRFRRSRDVGPYLGFRPRQRDSGQSEPELGISKEGDKFLRRLLVQGAHAILRRGAPDSDLRRWGLARLAETKKGQKTKKKKTVVAIARKLAVLLHHLWVSGEVYEPLHNSGLAAAIAA